ncbi:hypothetical protein [Lishizhenia sp.]|uniref:hypothetical protein n=1 Tax=Lishizhenia sp. TaxID=2497594 RepID=UPI00299D9233|nr:hypothetical protein [Lishizhenia sp.]MDX1445549.1 hypothetical protein [Lishizhenia sp.]
MQKIKSISLALLPILGVLVIGVAIYAFFQSTPALIFVFFLVLVSLLLSMGIYKRSMRKSKEKVKVVETDLPEIENDLIYIDPNNFEANFSKEKGLLYLAGEKVVDQEVTLTQVVYDKLTDDLKMSFSSGIKVIAKGMQNIGVGDQQVCLFYFDHMLIKVGKRSRSFTMHKKELYEVLEEEESHVIFTHKIPPLVFHW